MRLSAAKAGNVSRLDGVDISIIGAVILFTSGRYKILCTYPTLVGVNRLCKAPLCRFFDDLLQRITSFAFRVPSFELVSSPSLPSEE